MSESFVEVKDLSKDFGRQPVLDRLSFSIHSGEIVSVIGPSGCGKTELLRIIAGLSEASRGTIRFQGADRLPRVGVAFQRSSLFPWLTVRENLEICMNDLGKPKARTEELILNFLRRARLDHFRDHYPNQISGGMSQRVNVLRCFLSPGDILLMDEPFVHLDFVQRTELQKFMLDIWETERRTILFVTHDIDEAICISDRIVVLSRSPARILSEFRIRQPRSKQPEDMRQDPDYLRVFGEIRAILSAEYVHMERT